MKRSFIILVFLLAVLKLTAQRNFSITKNLEHDWYVYSTEEETLIPYLPEYATLYGAHTLLLDLQKNRNYHLFLKSTEPNQSLFINGALSRTMAKDSLVSIPLNRFKEDVLNVTVVGSSDITSKLAYIGIPDQLMPIQAKKANKELLAMNRRAEMPFKNAFVLGIFMVFCLFTATTFSYPRAFFGFFDVFGSFRANTREESMYFSKPLSRVNMAYLVLLAFISALIFWIFSAKGFTLSLTDVFFFQNLGTFKQLLNFILFIIGAFVMYTAKFVYLRLVCSIFGLNRFSDYHIFKTIQVSLSLLIPLLLILLWFYYNGGYMDWSKNLMLYIIFGFYFIRFIAFTLTLNKASHIPFHYFIAYLCVVEVLPLVLAIRFLV